MTIRRVLVTGATGRTGTLVLQKLRQHPVQFDAVGGSGGAGFAGA